MSLANLQREFTAYLRSDGNAGIPAVSLRSLRGLPVYHYAYRASLIDALRDVFERTHSWLGDERFDEAARVHIAAHPPNSWTMSDYGVGFDNTLAGLYPDNAEVPELAWLDWSLRIAFNGPDAPPLDMALLAEVDWDSARLQIAPTLAMRIIQTNVAAIWGALAEDDMDPPVAELLEQPAVLTVWRHDLMPRFHTVSDDEHQALIMANDGVAFGPICETLTAEACDADEVAARVGAMLGRWIAEGVLVGVS
jgi:Putative DNA-binding domain